VSDHRSIIINEVQVVEYRAVYSRGNRNMPILYFLGLVKSVFIITLRLAIFSDCELPRVTYSDSDIIGTSSETLVSHV